MGGKIGKTVTGAVEGVKSDSNKETFQKVDEVVDGIKGAINSVDRDIGIKDTVGTFTTSASDLAYQAVEKVADLNDKYKVTDQLKEKIEDATKSVSGKKA